MEAGHLVSDEIILGVVREELAKPEAAKGVIFDGVVRTDSAGRGDGAHPGGQGASHGCRAVLRRDRRGNSRRGWSAAARRSTAPTTIPRRWPHGSRPTATRPRRCSPGTTSAGRSAGFRPSARSMRSPRAFARRSGGSMITLKSPREIETMARAGRIVAGTLALMREIIRPGLSTEDLDAAAERFIRSYDGATPSFKGLYGFPKTLCTSIDVEIVHGIPSAKRVLARGEHRERRRRRAARRPARRLRHDPRGGRDQPRGGAAARGDAGVPGGGDRDRPGWGTTWATSGTRCRRWPRARATAWCGSWWATGSARGSTRSRRCPTTAAPSAGPACSKG